MSFSVSCCVYPNRSSKTNPANHSIPISIQYISLPLEMFVEEVQEQLGINVEVRDLRINERTYSKSEIEEGGVYFNQYYDTSLDAKNVVVVNFSKVNLLTVTIDYEDVEYCETSQYQKCLSCGTMVIRYWKIRVTPDDSRCMCRDCFGKFV